MEIENLKLFIEVARNNSFATVARHHNVDPSSISRTISALETELGVRLFQRTTRKLSLTEAGKNYFYRVLPLIEELEKAGEEAASTTNELQGTLRLTCSVAFGQVCILPLLPKFRAAYPDLRIELLMTDSNLDLINQRIDLAIRLGPERRDDLIGVKLMDTRYYVCGSPEYIKENGYLKTPSELSNRSCILFNLPEFQSSWKFRDLNGVEQDIPVHGDLIISNALAIRKSVLSGLGPGLLADWLIHKDLTMGRLVNLFPDYDVTATSFETAAWLLYPNRTFLPKKVRVAIDFLQEHLGS